MSQHSIPENILFKYLDFLGQMGEDYQVSNNGRLQSRRRGNNRPWGEWRDKKIHWDYDGYGHVGLWDPQTRKTKDCLIHRLVLLAFVGPCPDNMECRHLDGNSKNNRLENLRWGTHEEQYQDMIRHGTYKLRKGDRPGEQHHLAKLKKIQVEEIRKLYTTGKYTQKELGESFGVTQGMVGRIIRRDSWK